MVEKSSGELWSIVLRQMEGHVKLHRGDRTGLDALNRVCREVLATKGIVSIPRVGPDECLIRQASLSVADLKAVERHHTEMPSHESVDPPTVLLYQTRHFAIDGTKRINLAVKQGHGCDVLLISMR